MQVYDVSSTLFIALIFFSLKASTYLSSSLQCIGLEVCISDVGSVLFMACLIYCEELMSLSLKASTYFSPSPQCICTDVCVFDVDSVLFMACLIYC